MCIYCGTQKHRKIYENHTGAIPIDEHGRSYDIHHLDGNHSNNNPLNLKAVSIQEHYDIHYRQGDYGACWLIARNLKFSPAEISKLASAVARQRIAEGTHNFIGGELGKKGNRVQFERKTHKFLEPGFQRKIANKRIQDRTHHFLSKNGSSVSKDRVINGTHNFLGENSPTQFKWNCSVCNKTGKGKSNFSRYHGDNCKKTK